MSSTSAITTFSFDGDALEVIPSEGRVHVIVRRVCEALGVDADTQQRRLKSDAAISTVMMTVQMDGDDQRRDVLCIELRSLPLWLAKIHPRKVRPELRPKLVRYQREAAEVLADHFLGPRGAAVDRDVEPENHERALRGRPPPAARALVAGAREALDHGRSGSARRHLAALDVLLGGELPAPRTAPLAPVARPPRRDLAQLRERAIAFVREEVAAGRTVNGKTIVRGLHLNYAVGLALARQLLAEGAIVNLGDRRSPDYRIPGTPQSTH